MANEHSQESIDDLESNEHQKIDNREFDSDNSDRDYSNDDKEDNDIDTFDFRNSNLEEISDQKNYLEEINKTLLVFRNENLTKEEVSAALLSIFYSTGISQCGFKIVLKFLAVFVQNVPLSFDQCASILLNHSNDQISKTQMHYCTSCDLQVKLENCYQRRCKNCKTRQVYFIFV